MGNVNERVSSTLDTQIQELEDERDALTSVIASLKEARTNLGTTTAVVEAPEILSTRGAGGSHRVLAAIVEEGGLATTKRLKEKHGLNSGTCFGVFKRLSPQGVIERVLDPGGTSMTTYQVTDAGRAYLGRMEAELGFGSTNGAAADLVAPKPKATIPKATIPNEVLRGRILSALKGGELQRARLQEQTGGSTASISRETKKLVDEGIIQREERLEVRDGKTAKMGARPSVYFSLKHKEKIRLRAGHGEVAGD